MDDGQKTPRGHPDFQSYVKFQHVLYSRHLSGKHSFTLLSQPLRTDRITDGETYTLASHGLEEIFTVVLLCQFLVLAGNRFWFYILMYLEYNTSETLFCLMVTIHL